MTKIKLLLLVPIYLLFINVYSQNYVEKSIVYLDEKQNQPAQVIPSLLLEAYSNGDINAYYPTNSKIQVPYEQFLNHFGSASDAYKAITKRQPNWFCSQSGTVPTSKTTLKCMSYNFEIGEQDFRNNVTYQQETKLIYVKVIYSGECTVNGLEKEGPVFLIKDIRKLKKMNNYKIVNANNSAMVYAIADYLDLKLFRAVKKRN